MKLMKMTVEDFAAELASDSPAPGGGTIGATAGAFAAGLGAMVCRLTIGNDKYPDAQAVLPTALEVLDGAKDKFIYLADADTDAFNKVMAAFKMPKGTEEEIALRKAAIAAGNLEATLVPLSTAETAVSTAEALVQVVRYGNTNALSDIGTGIECARTAAQAAFMNVAINLPSVKDGEKAKEIAAKRDDLVKKSAFFYESALSVLKEKLDY